MATHSSTLAWQIPWMEDPERLQYMGSLGVGHDWATSLSLFTFIHWRRKWQPTPVFLPGESQGWGSLVGCHLWGCTESDTTEATSQQQQQQDHCEVSVVYSRFLESPESTSTTTSPTMPLTLLPPFKGFLWSSQHFLLSFLTKKTEPESNQSCKRKHHFKGNVSDRKTCKKSTKGAIGKIKIFGNSRITQFFFTRRGICFCVCVKLLIKRTLKDLSTELQNIIWILIWKENGKNFMRQHYETIQLLQEGFTVNFFSVIMVLNIKDMLQKGILIFQRYTPKVLWMKYFWDCFKII